jgi:hypothetical protein
MVLKLICSTLAAIQGNLMHEYDRHNRSLVLNFDINQQVFKASTSWHSQEVCALSSFSGVEYRFGILLFKKIACRHVSCCTRIRREAFKAVRGVNPTVQDI